MILTAKQIEIKGQLSELEWEQYEFHVMAFIDQDNYIVVEETGAFLYGNIDQSIKEEKAITVAKVKQLLKFKNFR